MNCASLERKYLYIVLWNKLWIKHYNECISVN